MIVYLAGPIDYEPDRGTSWREELISMCKNDGIAFFDPVSPYKFTTVTNTLAEYIHDVNMVSLNKADVIVGRMMRGQVSVGTPIELYKGCVDGKIMIIISDMEESVYIRYVCNHSILVKTIEEAYGALLKLKNAPEDIKYDPKDGIWSA